MEEMSEDLFESHRGLVFGVAYRMLGSVDEADDVVQETWLRWSAAPRDDVLDPRAYLARVAARLALDHVRRVARRRESYVGEWLPEPILTGPDVADDAALADTVSMAMLVVLETLSPLERAVFVLDKAFGFSHKEIGQALGRTEPAVRQLAHRARQHVDARRPRFVADRGVRTAVTERFMRAAAGGDLAALLDVLAPDVTLVSDADGKVRSPRHRITGAATIGAVFSASGYRMPPGAYVKITDINGVPGALALVDDVAFAAFVLEVDAVSERVTTIRLIANPEKLRLPHCPA
jgi:RNA polymerase sigma-70 factor (ECF subfamily)